VGELSSRRDGGVVVKRYSLARMQEIYDPQRASVEHHMFGVCIKVKAKGPNARIELSYSDFVREKERQRENQRREDPNSAQIRASAMPHPSRLVRLNRSRWNG